MKENSSNISSSVTPELITSLKPGEIFVFGSNLQGTHGGGAARIALERFGAIRGQGVGLQGQSYAIPTMHGGVDVIKPYVDEFIVFATKHTELYFYVTRIGCGIAGFKDEDMAPLFKNAALLENVSLPLSFRNIIGKVQTSRISENVNEEMDNREYFLSALRATGRAGIDNVVENLEKLGFFNAPASSAFHLNTPGGLLHHSVNVYREALAIREKQIEMCPEAEAFLPLESIAIAALLHDVCKAEIYKLVPKSRKAENGTWEKYMGYDVDYSALPLGHGEKSVIRLLQWGLEMTDDEMCAIRWHMGAWDMPFQSPEAKGCSNAAKAKTPLVALICAADGLASFVLER